MADKRRNHLRIKPNRPLLVHYPNYLGRVRDVSVTGAFIESDRPLLPGTRIHLTLWLDVERSVKINTVVRRVEPLRGMGVEFLELSGGALRNICHYWDFTPPELPHERRNAFPRVRLTEIVLAEVLNSYARVRDLNPFGAFIEDRRYLPPGVYISLRLWLDSLEPIPVDAKICRVERGAGIGIQFSMLQERDYHRLCSYLSVNQ